MTKGGSKIICCPGSTHLQFQDAFIVYVKYLRHCPSEELSGISDRLRWNFPGADVLLRSTALTIPQCTREWVTRGERRWAAFPRVSGLPGPQRPRPRPLQSPPPPPGAAAPGLRGNSGRSARAIRGRESAQRAVALETTARTRKRGAGREG